MQRYQFVQDLDGSPIEIVVLETEQGPEGYIVLVQVRAEAGDPEAGAMWVTLEGLEANKLVIVPLADWPARR